MDATHEITGHTRVLGILADPIAHVRAPAPINAIAHRRGRDAIMVPLQVSPKDLAQVAASLRLIRSFDGAIVTMPHKEAMTALCDTVSDRAASAGIVNVIRREDDGRLVGDAFDGVGFLKGLSAAGIQVDGRRAYIAGSGGAARAIAHALVDAGVSALTVYNRTAAKAEELRARLSARFRDVEIKTGTTSPEGHDLVVNGTSLGMRPDDPYPLDIEGLSADMVVADVVMDPQMTPLLVAARARGCQVQCAAPMLENQLELMADFLRL